jgi:predicted ATP-grasp superfamily ATP-dependent carboligase
MTRRIVQLIEEQENKSKLFSTRIPDVKVARALEDSQKIAVSVSNIEEVLPLSIRRESQQHEVTMSKENKNQNGKRITEMNLTRKKARKLSKKRAKIDRLQNIPEGTSQNGKLAEIELCRDIRLAT